MGEYALYCGLGDRVAVLTYTKQEEKKHLLLEKDLAAYGTSGKSRTRRRRITPEDFFHRVACYDENIQHGLVA